MTRLRILSDDSLSPTFATGPRALAATCALLLAAACGNDGAPADAAAGAGVTPTSNGSDITAPPADTAGDLPPQTEPGVATPTGSSAPPSATPPPLDTTSAATVTTPTQLETEGSTTSGSTAGSTDDDGVTSSTTDSSDGQTTTGMSTEAPGSGAFDRLAACSGGPYGDPLMGAGAPQPVTGSEGGGDNFYIAEGPVWLDGAVYFSLFSGAEGNPSTIKRYTPGGSVEDFIVDSGSNGLAIDIDGNLLAATHDQQRLSKYDVASKARSTVVETYMGQAFNSPNDVAVHSNGTIYFTDPDHQNGGRPSVGDKSLYVVQGDQITAVSTAHSNGGAGPNGVALSLDETTLYVSGSGAPVQRFSVDEDGNLGEESSFTESGYNGDGMTLDCAGNVYLAVNNGVSVFSPEGSQVGTLTTPTQATNVAFGGTSGTTLYITTFAQGAAGLHQVEMAVPGLPY